MALTKQNKALPTRVNALILALVACAFVSPEVGAQNADTRMNATPGHRKIPQDARLGVAQIQQQNVLEINGVAWFMSPGATVRDERNMLVNINSLYQKRAVRFTSSPQGMVDKVWILSTNEASNEALDNAGVERPNFIRDTVNGVLNTLF